MHVGYHLGLGVGTELDGGSGAIVPQVPALPSTALAYWHSEINCAASAWVDPIGGLSLTGVNTPTVATDTGHFSERVVAKASFSGTRYWGNRSLGDILAASSRPWTFTVARFRTTAVNNYILTALGRSGVQTHYVIQTVTAPQISLALNNGGVVVNGPNTASNTGVKRWKTWADGTNANLQVGSTLYQSAYVGSLPQAVNAVCIGSAAHVQAFEGDVNVAFYLVCTAKPTAEEEAVLDAWAQAYFGAA